MKKIQYILPIVMFITFMTSCEESVDIWMGADRINFASSTARDTAINYSFVFVGETATHDTVWLEVRTQGKMYDFPRPVKLKTVAPYGGNQAQAGVHYVDLENSSLKNFYVIPSGANSARLPIVLLRDNSLKEKPAQLRIEFEDNEYFQKGFSGNWAHRTIIVTDMLSKPQIWDSGPRTFFGVYGQAKHRFMIETANQAFDDAWMSAHFSGSTPLDRDYIQYLAAWLQKKLNERNEREGNVLTEDDGTVVRFQ